MTEFFPHPDPYTPRGRLLYGGNGFMKREKPLLPSELDKVYHEIVAGFDEPNMAIMTLECAIHHIYGAYSRKVGRRKALLEIERAIRRLTKEKEIGGVNLTTEAAVAGLYAATVVFARSPAGNRGVYTPHPATWFHQSRYLDDVKEWHREQPDESRQYLLARANEHAFNVALGRSSAGSGSTKITQTRACGNKGMGALFDKQTSRGR